MSEHARKSGVLPTTVFQVVGGKDVNKPNVQNIKAKFVPRCDRETWADAWLNKRAGLMKLTRTNKGLGQLAIEDALIDEINERLRRVERLERQALYMKVSYGAAA